MEKQDGQIPEKGCDTRTVQPEDRAAAIRWAQEADLPLSERTSTKRVSLTIQDEAVRFIFRNRLGHCVPSQTEHQEPAK